MGEKVLQSVKTGHITFVLLQTQILQFDLISFDDMTFCKGLLDNISKEAFVFHRT